MSFLHWIKPPEAAIESIYRCLESGGRFVAEFGGKGNVKAIVSALALFLNEWDCIDWNNINPWYFPSIGEYTSLLERQGFEVNYAILFDRPTPLEDGEDGLRNWLQMFANSCLERLSVQQQKRIISAVEEYLKPTLYINNTWIADYRRIRVVAIKH